MARRRRKCKVRSLLSARRKRILTIRMQLSRKSRVTKMPTLVRKTKKRLLQLRQRKTLLKLRRRSTIQRVVNQKKHLI